MKGGLKPLTKDNRDYYYKKVFGAPVYLPTSDFLVVEPIFIEDQKETDYCAGMAVSTASELQEGVDLDPLYAFAKTKQIMGDWKSWGADLRSACKAMVKFGCIEKKDSPYDINDKREIVANWENWPKELDEKAKKHRKESYFRVDEGSDLFNTLRGVLWAHRSEKMGIVTGVLWREGWLEAKNGIIPEEETQQWFGHAICFLIGQKYIDGQPYLIAQLSNGDKIGDKGLFYFSKKVVNRDFTFGAFMLNDMPAGQARRKAWSIWRRIWEWLKKLFKQYVGKQQ